MSATQNPAANDAGRAFIDGTFRKQFGLEVKDLRIGLDVAKAMIQRGEPGEALRIYLALVLCDPTQVDFQVGLANCALLINEPHLGLQAASVVIATSPRDPRGFLLSGRCCVMMGQWAEAKEDLTDAMEKAKVTKDTAVFEQAKAFLDIVNRNT